MKKFLGIAMVLALLATGGLASATTQEGAKFAEGLIPSKNPVQLPGNKLGQVQWDIKPLEKKFTILKVQYDVEEQCLTVLLEAKLSTYVGPGSFRVFFFDEDGVDVGGNYGLGHQVYFSPSKHLEKGERVRAKLYLPSGWEHTKRVSFKTPY